jgi:hypothetical protein
VRKGARLFDDGDAIPLKLLSSQTFATGVLHLIYTRDEDAPMGGYEEAKAHLQR